jgi:hypothetical protein
MVKQYLSFGGGVNSTALLLLLTDQGLEFETVFVNPRGVIEMPDLPEPQEGVDYYPDELRTHTVAIEVTVGGMKERDSDEEIRSRAVVGLRDGSLDGDATIMHSEKVRDVELDFKTDLPFDRAAWKKAKLLELGINENGDPLRPGEKVRPECETTLTDYTKQSRIARIIDRIIEWRRRCIRAFKEAFL